MKRIIYILFLTILFFNCESQQNKSNRLHKERVLNSDYFNASITNILELKMQTYSVKKGLVSERNFINRYNYSMGLELGFSENIDTIIDRINRNESAYRKYLIADAFMTYSRDSLERAKYNDKKKRIKELFR